MSKPRDTSVDSATIEQRVRYVDCDPMSYVHHSVYPVWFEMARTELLRQRGIAYRQMEEEGLFIAVVRMNVSYRQPAKYDDVVRITATLKRMGMAKIEHDYEVRRGDVLLATASTTLAVVDREGRAMRVPAWLMGKG
jgi:acyl-CoA thioester hydrolase